MKNLCYEYISLLTSVELEESQVSQLTRDMSGGPFVPEAETHTLRGLTEMPVQFNFYPKNPKSIIITSSSIGQKYFCYNKLERIFLYGLVLKDIAQKAQAAVDAGRTWLEGELSQFDVTIASETRYKSDILVDLEKTPRWKGRWSNKH